MQSSIICYEIANAAEVLRARVYTILLAHLNMRMF